ncbi:MAG TPA: HYExAFE family protein [Sedimentisphaerales bacterium]|nr:HYExAFE family protein [Sedimentisphaerales bacterium]
MKNYHLNHYEQAFGNWLIDNRIQYIAVDEHKKAVFGRSKLKSFDYLLYKKNGQAVTAEVKGRKFKGTSFEKLTSLECWVTIDDIEGLSGWQRVFAKGSTAIFVFVYKTEQPDVDFDGRDAYEFDSNRYVFFCIRLADYVGAMKQRSGKWRTVTLAAEDFRRYAVPIDRFLL